MCNPTSPAPGAAPPAASTPQVVELSLPADPSLVRVVRLALTGVASRMGFNYDQIEDMKLALGEACNNAIQYHAAEDGASLRVRLEIFADRLEIIITNPGGGWELPDPSSPLGAGADQNLPEHGFGLLLMRSVMDGVDQPQSAAGQTSVRMVKRLPSS